MAWTSLAFVVPGLNVEMERETVKDKTAHSHGGKGGCVQVPSDSCQALSILHLNIGCKVLCLRNMGR